MSDSLLNGYRALDLTDEKGFVCGQILATLGIDVIKIEKPGGDPARNIPPFYHDTPDPEKSLYWFAFNNNKKSITLNLEKSQGQDLFRNLVKKVDFVLESFHPGYMDGLGLGYEALSRLNKRVIVTSITHFGQKGPHRHYKGSELVDSAMSGVMDNTGDMDRAPLKEALDSAYFHAGAAAALGTIISHYSRETDGEGQQVDVSIQEVATSRTALCLLPWQWDKRLIKRSGPMMHLGLRPLRAIWPCKDGYVLWFYQGGQIGAPANRALSQWIDEEGMVNPLSQVTNWEEHDIADVSKETHDAFQSAIYNFFMKHTKKEIAEEGLKRGINAVVECIPSDVLENPQLKARNLWTNLDHPELSNTFAFPRHFFLCSETENYIKVHSPGIGQDNDYIFVKELGLSSAELAALKEANVI
jgi:crotonobetainyl-CoA:carnitine CoA-transferase CaiB-like acyl-CoA transferase